MSQKIIKTKYIREYLIDHPKAKNKDLYLFFEANTDKQKGIIRKIKNRIDKKKKVSNIPPGDNSPGDKLTSEYIEKLIKDGLDDDPKNIQLIGKAVDFFVKVKTDRKEGTKQLLNMEAFFKLAEDNQNE